MSVTEGVESVVGGAAENDVGGEEHAWFYNCGGEDDGVDSGMEC